MALHPASCFIVQLAMSTLLSLLPLVLAFILFALLTKLAARLYRGSRLSWKHAFAYGALVMLVGGVGTVLNYSSGVVLGPFLGFILGVSAQLVLGGWFLGSRAVAPTGETVSFKGGTLIAAIVIGIALAMGVVVGVLVPWLGR